jgi:polyvinyl alcohol dehydrogenase (cytochrome)
MGPAFTVALLVSLSPGLAAVPEAEAANATWPTYLQNNGRSGFNSLETAINPTTAADLQLNWSAQANGTISTQPIVANNLVYWGAWDGYLRASVASGPRTGQQKWSTFLGQTQDFSCNPSTAGVADSPTVATVSVNGAPQSLLFVGGGGNLDANGNPVPNAQAQLLALNALTGAIIWQTPLGAAPATFMWSSPAYFSGSVYVGLASFGDCPLIQGQLVKLDAATGAVQATFDVVGNGCTGGSIWGSPTIDATAGTIYVATGNNGSCSAPNYSESVVELRLADLSVLGSWAVPASLQVSDSDFGSTPTLFTAPAGSTTVPMVGVQNKDGIFFAFVRNQIGRGPRWMRRISTGGGCPQCGSGSIAPAAWDGANLYVGGGSATVNGQTCAGDVLALNPANGSPVWQSCLPGIVLGAVSAVPGVLAVSTHNAFGGSSPLLLLSASTGAPLLTYPGIGIASFYGAPAIVNGVLYVGDESGVLYALK